MLSLFATSLFTLYVDLVVIIVNETMKIFIFKKTKIHWVSNNSLNQYWYITNNTDNV